MFARPLSERADRSPHRLTAPPHPPSFLLAPRLRSRAALLGSWALTYGLVFGAVSLLSVAVAGSTFLSASSKSLLLLFFGLFGAAEVALALLLSAFFGKAKLAAVVAPLVHFAILLPRYVFFKTGAPQARGRGAGGREVEGGGRRRRGLFAPGLASARRTDSDATGSGMHWNA